MQCRPEGVIGSSNAACELFAEKAAGRLKSG
jgi:hypothetical protein